MLFSDLATKKLENRFYERFPLVSSVLVAKPPKFSILAWLREHILSNILSIVAGDAGNIQYQ